VTRRSLVSAGGRQDLIGQAGCVLADVLLTSQTDI
jgi:hypothetical protein